MSNEVVSTRLRNVRSKDPDKVAAYFNSLPYKVELKSAVVLRGKVVQYFVLPDTVGRGRMKEIFSGDLDERIL